VSTEGENVAEREEKLRGQLDREEEDRHGRPNVDDILQKQLDGEEHDNPARVIAELRAALAVREQKIAEQKAENEKLSDKLEEGENEKAAQEQQLAGCDRRVR